MASTYYIKAYYPKQHRQQSEIRRFSIDISSENDVYQELCTKLATYQPDIQLNGFTLQYIDEENERITFSSNEELRSAISSNRDGNALKIFVSIHQSRNQQEDIANKDCHVGVECDNCNGSVVGCRYKCMVCPNYDLCENCSTAGIHSEHNMIKIAKPENFYHPYRSGHQSRSHHYSFPPSFVPSSEFFEQIQVQIPQWLPNRENTAHIRDHVHHHINNIKTNTQSQIQNSKQYLESVGQYLQQALSPFGVDCDYRVDGVASSSRTNNTNTQQQASTNETAARSESRDAHNESNRNSERMNTNSESNQQQQQQQQGVISSWLNRLRSTSTNASTATSSEVRQTSEKAVEECIEKMKAMGFDDTDEDLLELIRSKNGDIILVLDEMGTRVQ